MAKTTFTGRLQDVKVFQKEGNKNYVLTIREQNDYKNKTGEFAGKYGSQFFDVRFFAKTEKQEEFIENVIAPRKGDNNKIMSVECEIRNNNFTDKDGNNHYENQFVAQDFKLLN